MLLSLVKWHALGVLGAIPVVLLFASWVYHSLRVVLRLLLVEAALLWDFHSLDFWLLQVGLVLGERRITIRLLRVLELLLNEKLFQGLRLLLRRLMTVQISLSEVMLFHVLKI